jgi:hypothetical protein
MVATLKEMYEDGWKLIDIDGEKYLKLINDNDGTYFLAHHNPARPEAYFPYELIEDCIFMLGEPHRIHSDSNCGVMTLEFVQQEAA